MAIIRNSPVTAYDYEAITVADTAIGCTASKIKVTTALGSGTAAGLQPTNKFADEVFITVESQPVRYRLDGTNPTASEGHLVQPAGTIEIEGYENIAKFRAIRQGASSGTLRVTYFTRG